MASVYIDEDLLEALLEAARRKYPREFFVLLEGEKREEGFYITSFVYIPWKEGYHHAIIDLSQVPHGVIGSFHSHPGSPHPSKSDLASFPSLGHVHLIAGYPFTQENVKAFDVEGRELRIVVRGQRASF